MTRNSGNYQKNLFCSIETFLSDPSVKNENSIKKLSHMLTEMAIASAMETTCKSRNEIGADEYMPELIGIVAKQAEEAEQLSLRMYRHEKCNPDSSDQPFILRLSEKEFQMIRAVKSWLLTPKNGGDPNGLIFAIDGYILTLRTQGCLTVKNH